MIVVEMTCSDCGELFQDRGPNLASVNGLVPTRCPRCVDVKLSEADERIRQAAQRRGLRWWTR
jgi:hypothetical protein